MNLKEWNDRLKDEQWRFRKLCEEARVFHRVGTIRARRAVEFAEGLILDLSDEEARTRIQANAEGAAAVLMVTHQLVFPRSNRETLAGRISGGDLPPFYLLASLVLDAAADRVDSGDPPTGMDSV